MISKNFKLKKKATYIINAIWVTEGKKCATTFSRKTKTNRKTPNQTNKKHWALAKKCTVSDRKKANSQKLCNHINEALISYSFHKVILQILFPSHHLTQWGRWRNILPILQMRKLMQREKGVLRRNPKVASQYMQEPDQGWIFGEPSLPD